MSKCYCVAVHSHLLRHGISAFAELGRTEKFVSIKLAMDDLAYDVLLEIGIRIQPLPVWEEEWNHPETYSNPRLLHNIEREGIWL